MTAGQFRAQNAAAETERSPKGKLPLKRDTPPLPKWNLPKKQTLPQSQISRPPPAGGSV